MCRAVFCCKQGTECSGYTKGVQFLDQLTDCEEDQEAFRPTYCVSIRMLSTSRRSVPRLCGQSDPFSISYTFDGIQANETKINVGQYICYVASSDLTCYCSYGRPHSNGQRYFTGKYRANYMEET